jgi:hypothetical protein
MLQYEYAREALKNGLLLEARLGTNPYKFGMVGSTDSHTALSTAEEDNFFGKHSGTELSRERMRHPFTKTKNGAFQYARVIEIPTPRWIVYDAFRFGVEIPKGAKTIHQERAYTSPIWYTPG